MSSTTFRVDTDKGQRVALAIYEAFLGERGIFQDRSDLLENQIPTDVEPRSRAHGNFLFFLTAQDHGVKSRRLYARARHLYQQDPSLFDPCLVLAKYQEDQAALVSAVAKPLQTRYPNETARQWLLNSKTLVEAYGGDARAIFQQAPDAAEAVRRVRQFRGFGPKTSLLLFRAYHGLGFCSLRGTADLPIPVDIHDTRIALMHGVLDVEPCPESITSTNYARYAPAAQDAWRRVCTLAGLDWLVLDRALWLVGSRGCDPRHYLTCCIRRDCSSLL